MASGALFIPSVTGELCHRGLVVPEQKSEITIVATSSELRWAIGRSSPTLEGKVSCQYLDAYHHRR